MQKIKQTTNTHTHTHTLSAEKMLIFCHTGEFALSLHWIQTEDIRV